MEKRNPAYKGHDDVSVYDPNVEIKRAAIQKSTAFDATEKPDVSSSLGDGIKNLKMQMAAAEKPLIDGPLTFLSAGSGDVEGGKKVWVTMLLNKKVLCMFNKQADADADPPEPTKEFHFQSTHTIRTGPGSRTFCIMEGDKELMAFQSDKSRRDAWVSAAQDILKLAQSTKKIKVTKPAPAPAPPEEEAPRPKPSFLAGITGGLKKKSGGDGDGAGASKERASFLGAIAAKKKDGGAADGGGSAPAPPKPSFLDAIAARKKTAPPAPPADDSASEPGSRSEGGGANVVDAVAARKKPAPDHPIDAPTPTVSAVEPPLSAVHGDNTSTEKIPKPKKERKVRTGDI